MIDFHQDEKSFWKDLNPARFYLLARAYRGSEESEESAGKTQSGQPGPAPAGRESLRADGKWGNLSEYLGGG